MIKVTIEDDSQLADLMSPEAYEKYCDERG
jgi:hypothetical protein